MREIKFRAWDEENCEMVYFNNRKLTADEYQRAHLAMLLAGDYGDVLMQYTDLKDRNGVEIFEGDIIKFEDGHRFPYVVVWYQSDFGCGWKKKRGDSITDIGAECLSMRIIGNIHENPELLERKA